MSLAQRAAHILAALAALVAPTVGGTALGTSPTFATTGSLSSVSWTISNSASNVGNAAAYTWDFTTATTAKLTSATMTVPSGTTGSSLNVIAYGLGKDTASVTLVGAMVTVTLSGGAPIVAGTEIELAVAGFNNGTATGSQTSTVTINDQAGVVGTGKASTVFAGNTTSVTVIVPESLTITDNEPSITLLPVPGTPDVEGFSSTTLTVATNVTGGYTLNVCAAPFIGGPRGIPQQSSMAALSDFVFGTKVFVTGGPAVVKRLWSPKDYIGHAATCLIVVDNKPTSLGTLTMTNTVVSATQAAGTINYLVAPSF